MSIRRKHRIEYRLLTATRQIVRLLPHPMALALGWTLARLAFHVFRFRRRETLRRIRSVFGETLAPRRVRAIAWESLRNTVFNAVEMLRADRIPRERLLRRMHGYEATRQCMHQLIETHGGLIAAVAHMGNWDLAGIVFHEPAMPVFSIAARQRNPLTNQLIHELRQTSGMEILERGAYILRPIVKRLRSGQLLAILPDVRTPYPDLSVRFLGGTANVGRGMAQFARSANVPILPLRIRREGWQYFRFEPLAPIVPDKKLDKPHDLHRMTQQVLDLFDAAIRADPGQWFWYNKRWILDPVAETATTPPDTETPA